MNIESDNQTKSYFINHLLIHYGLVSQKKQGKITRFSNGIIPSKFFMLSYPASSSGKKRVKKRRLSFPCLLLTNTLFLPHSLFWS